MPVWKGRGGGGEAGGGEVGRGDGDGGNVRGVGGLQAAREPALERGLALLQLGGLRSRLLQLGGADLWPARRRCCCAQEPRHLRLSEQGARLAEQGRHGRRRQRMHGRQLSMQFRGSLRRKMER